MFAPNPELDALHRDWDFAKKEIVRLQKMKPKKLLRLKDEIVYCVQVKAERAEEMKRLRAPKDNEVIASLRIRRAKARKDARHAQRAYTELLATLKALEMAEQVIQKKLFGFTDYLSHRWEKPEWEVDPIPGGPSQ
jgi:hypothetical protein